MERVNADKRFYDLFFIDPRGEIVYTVEKESDFATNLRSGRWRETGLARAFEQALRDGTSGKIAFADYEPYAPSNFDPAAFMARTIFSATGDVLGVVAVQLPTSTVSSIIGEKFGRTGTAYIVGQDGRLRMNLLNRAGRRCCSPCRAPRC